MPKNTSAPRQRATRPQESKQASKERNELADQQLHALRVEMEEGIKKIAAETGKTIEWVQMQLYQGGKLLKKRRAVNPYNAALSRAAKERREQGLPSLGRQTIAILSKEVAAAEEWKAAPEEEIEDWIQDILDKREVRRMRVTDKTVGRDVQTTAGLLETEAAGLHKRTGAEYLLLTLTHNVTDTYDARVTASNGVKKGIEELYKQTPEEMGLRLQAFINAGVIGAVKTMRENQTVSLKTAIRKAVTDGLHDILREEKNIPDDAMPRMEWAQYETLCALYGVKLEGWTGPDGMCNPADLKGVAELQKLKNALDNRRCFWVTLTDDEWAMYKTAENERVARRKGKGKAVAENVNNNAMDIDEGTNMNTVPFIFPPAIPPMPAFSFAPYTEFYQGNSTGY
ncbi:hypothetical protein BC629DRAFT_1442871 [Irpex lacteus]|nr:hypothetical protein BC629DRAFT_1442871 [Irpex lacteus]